MRFFNELLHIFVLLNFEIIPLLSPRVTDTLLRAYFVG
jgi:hypothetical protein